MGQPEVSLDQTVCPFKLPATRTLACCFSSTPALSLPANDLSAWTLAISLWHPHPHTFQFPVLTLSLLPPLSLLTQILTSCLASSLLLGPLSSDSRPGGDHTAPLQNPGLSVALAPGYSRPLPTLERASSSIIGSLFLQGLILSSVS